MPDPHWENLKEIFHAAVALAPAERYTYLDHACGGNASLRQAVESLLKSHEETGNFVDAPAYHAAAEMLVDGLDLKAGKNIAHYRIVRLIGEGGMGKVYLAEDTKLHRRVSLKFLSTHFTQDHERLRRFEQEARAVSALNHPNILTIHEIGEVDGHRFIATEFIEGQTLRERLRSSMDIGDALDVSIQVASALVAAHRVNIVHRDIKPENIMIRHDDGLVKVLDFGLAKMSVPRSSKAEIDREAETRMRANTTPGVVMGTVAYMSPEQARGDAVDERTDIWSLGVVLYEMIAGSSPFVAATSNEIISGILSKEPPPPLARYSRMVPERLAEIAEKALTKNREERYQTSKDLLIDLKRLKQSLELRAGMERTASSEKLGAPPTSDREVDITKNMTSEDAAGTQPASSAEYIVNQVKSHRRGATAIAAVMLLAIATGIFVYAWRLKHVAASAPAEIKSLAVLPLKSLDTGDSYLGIGIADAVIRRISQTGQLTVRPTSAVLKFVKGDADSLAAARQLNADAVLEGTVQHAGDRLRVSVNLLRTSDGASLWADSFDMTAADVFVIQDKVAQQVAARLQLRFDSAQQARLNEQYPTDPVAYEAYIKGIFSLDQRSYAGEDAMSQMNTTIDFFKKAIAVDPQYALAHAQFAFAYVWTAQSIEPANSKWVELAREEIKRSQELGPNLAETHLANALLLWGPYSGYQNEAAIRELLLAKQLNPNSGHGELPASYGHIGLDELAKSELQRDINIDPTSASLKDLTMILPYLSGDVDAWLAARQKLDPTAGRPAPWYFLRKGNLGEAQKAIDERLPRAPDDNDLLMQEALLLALKGDFHSAQERVPGIL